MGKWVTAPELHNLFLEALAGEEWVSESNTLTYLGFSTEKNKPVPKSAGITVADIQKMNNQCCDDLLKLFREQSKISLSNTVVWLRRRGEEVSRRGHFHLKGIGIHIFVLLNIPQKKIFFSPWEKPLGNFTVSVHFLDITLCCKQGQKHFVLSPLLWSTHTHTHTNTLFLPTFSSPISTSFPV